MIETIKELVAIPSVTGAPAQDGMPFGKAVHNALMYMLKLCDDFGFRTKNCGDYLGWAEIGEGEELMGILCHLDVVPPGGGWSYDPFSAQVAEGRLYGRGVMDDKGPAVAAVYAMKDILDSGRQLKKRIRIIFGCQEETGDWDDMEYYKKTEELPGFGFTPDADFPAIYGEKGILRVDLSMSLADSGFAQIKGGEAPNMVADWAVATLAGKDGKRITLEAKGKAAHGSTPEDGENAVTKLMEQAADLDQAGTVNCSFARFYMEQIGYCLDGRKINCQLKDDASGSLTFNVGMVDSDEETVSLKVDIRYPVTYDEKHVFSGIENSVKPYGVKAVAVGGMKPVYMDRDGEIIAALMEVYREVTGDFSEAMVMGGGTYARAMEHIVAFGPVFPGRECTEHQRDEYILIEDLEKARKIYRLAIEKLCS